MQEPTNIDIAKKESIQYYDSGNYFNDIYKKAAEAEELLLKNTVDPSKCCVIFDLDDTMVSLYDFMLANDFAWTDEVLEKSFKITDFPRMPDIHDLFGYCVSKKYYTVILTSRRQKYYLETYALILNSGYSSYSKLILRPNEDVGTIQNFKKVQRDKLSQNYKIVFNIGDQLSDLKDDPKEEELPSNAIKIPNSFYLVSCYV